MGSVWGFITLIVVAAVLLAFGFAQQVGAFLVVGFLMLAVAGIFGVKGRLPEQH